MADRNYPRRDIARDKRAGQNERIALQRQRSITQAVDEGHDADIPSDVGYILDEDGERRRRAIIQEQRRNSFAKKQRRTESRREEQPGSMSLEKDFETTENFLSDDELNVVNWEENDPENPYNWSGWYKFLNCFFVSALTLLAPLGSSIFAPGVGELMREFQSDSLELASFVVSVYVLGFAAGPLIIAPLSEIYGRVIVYHVCNVCFIAFLVGCALAPSLNALIVFRFFSGAFGSAPLSNGGGTIADMITQEKRAKAMAVFSLGPLMGPVIGPIAGGFLAGSVGWRWSFWLMAILTGAIAIPMLFFARETYHPVLLQRRVDRLRKETGNDLLRSKLDAGLSNKDYFKRSIVRPLRMLFFSPICAIYAAYMAIIYGYLYLLFTSVSKVFTESYNFTTSTVGLVFLGLGIGSLIGMGWYSFRSDRIVKKNMQSAQEGGPGAKPEDRLLPMPVGAIAYPIGFFIYGWTAQNHVHWIVPILSHVIIGFGNVVIFMSLSMALVDTFTIYAASALAANTVARSILGAVLPLAGLPMYEALGLGWGNSLLGFIAVAMIPIPFLIIRYGVMLREKYPIKNL